MLRLKSHERPPPKPLQITCSAHQPQRMNTITISILKLKLYQEERTTSLNHYLTVEGGRYLNLIIEEMRAAP